MWLAIVLALALAVPVAGCSSDRREWMKLGTPYTVEEFRRDYAECSKSKTLDDACMRARGWVDVSPKAEKAPEQQRTAPGGTRVPGPAGGTRY